MPLVYFSVIIPLYNKAMHVHRALRSVAAQVFRDYEVIIVDDGSSDGSAEVVEKLLQPGWQLLRQENRGVSAARNRGAEASQGEYLCFLDADDEWHPRYLSCMHDLINAFPGCGMYGANYAQATPEQENDDFAASVISCFRGRRCQLFRDWLIRNPMNSDSVIIPNAVFRSLGGFQVGQKYYEDATLMFKIAAEYPVTVTDQVLTRYYVGLEESANARMQQERPLYPGYLPFLLEARKRPRAGFWLRFFTMVELFVLFGGHVYLRQYERNLSLFDEFPELASSWHRAIYYEPRWRWLVRVPIVGVLKTRGLLLRLFRRWYV